MVFFMAIMATFSGDVQYSQVMGQLPAPVQSQGTQRNRRGQPAVPSKGQ